MILTVLRNLRPLYGTYENKTKKKTGAHHLLYQNLGQELLSE